MAITLREIAEEDLELIMKWRMSEDVTKYMNTNPKLTIEDQKKEFALRFYFFTVFYSIL